MSLMLIEGRYGVLCHKMYCMQHAHACNAGQLLGPLDGFGQDLNTVHTLYLGDPGKARGCSTNTSVIHSLINSVMVCENIFTAPPGPNV